MLCLQRVISVKKVPGSDMKIFSGSSLLTLLAEIILHSIVNSTHLYSLTYIHDSRKNCIVQMFRKSFHPIIRRYYQRHIERQRAIQLLTDFSVRKTAEKNRRILQETDLAGCSVGADEKPSFFQKRRL